MANDDTVKVPKGLHLFDKQTALVKRRTISLTLLKVPVHSFSNGLKRAKRWYR